MFKSTFSAYAAVLVLAAAFSIHGAALAQETWPSKPIQVIVPFPPGAVDSKARIVVDQVSKLIGQPMVVLNRPGAGMRIGTEQLLRSPKDGYTIGVVSQANSWLNPLLDPASNYEPLKDFSLISIAYEATMILVAKPSLGVKNLSDLITLARSKPGQLHYGAPAGASGYHVWFEAFKGAANLDISHVAYKGLAQAVQDVVSGQTDVALADVGSIPLIKAGRLIPLATTGARRHPQLADVPTLSESGVPLVATSWLGFVAPAGVPADAERRLRNAFLEALGNNEVRQALERDGAMVPPTLGAEAFREVIESDMKQFKKTVKAGTISL